jgi:RNA polymerase sigma-70 factor (ECF subfamily)
MPLAIRRGTRRGLSAYSSGISERYDVDELVSFLHEDVEFSMPPYALWLRGPEAVRAWLAGRGCGCRGSRLVPASSCGSPAFAQYRQGGKEPWALPVLELSGEHIAAWTSFLDMEVLFPPVPMGFPAGGCLRTEAGRSLISRGHIHDLDR